MVLDAASQPEEFVMVFINRSAISQMVSFVITGDAPQPDEEVIERDDDFDEQYEQGKELVVNGDGVA